MKNSTILFNMEPLKENATQCTSFLNLMEQYSPLCFKTTHA